MPNRLSISNILIGLSLFAGAGASALVGRSVQQAATQSQVALEYAGADGTIQYVWTLPVTNTYDLLGQVEITSQLNGVSTLLNVPLTMDTTAGGLKLQSVASAGTNAYNFAFSSGSTSVTLKMQVSLSGKSLVIGFQANNPVVTMLGFSLSPSASSASTISVPYYDGAVTYFPNNQLFMNGYFEWQKSSATMLNATQALYQPLTNGQRVAASEQLVLSVSENLADVLPSVPNPASPYMSQLAGRTVLDIWDQQNFGQLYEMFNLLSDYGVKNCAVIVHGWQGNGFDNALPATYPASAAQGGNAVLSEALGTATQMGCYAALHQNYVDYYPNYPLFTDSAIVLNSNGTLKTGWLNGTTGIQAYQTKPTWEVTNATTQSPEIHSGLGTTATFLDVNSASLPWFRVDMDAGQAGAGTISASANASIALWNYERKTNGGPVFGEGLNHWYWSGLLDGVEAQFGAGNANSLAEAQPLFVDFDVLKIHPFQVNHGVGMYERWLTSGESMASTNLQDAYRMQELIYGHAPYIGDGAWMNIARVLTEQNLVSPVAQRYGTQTATGVKYQVNGTWGTSTAAAKANEFSRVAVQYANGDIITANSQAATLTVDAYQLPQYGWLATGTGLLAYTALNSGIISDYSQTSTAYFANARNQSDVAASGSVSTPSVTNFVQTAAFQANISLQWKVLDGSGGSDLVCLVHFIDANGNIAFVGDHSLSTATSAWQPGQIVSDTMSQFTIPSNVANGTYSMRVGLYSPISGFRFPLYGNSDGNGRYIVGNLTIANNGKTLSFQAQGLPSLPSDPRLNGTGTPVNFQTIRTDGMVSIDVNQQQNAWTLQAYPRYRDVVIQLNSTDFPMPSSITCDSATVTPSSSGIANFWQVHVNGAKQCQWTQ